MIGDPTISTTDGEINLTLMGVNGITSGGPGATLTFAGLEGLLLATQNGSINLGSEISFAGLRDLTFYARGVESELNLASSISVTNDLNLYSEGNVNLSGDVSAADFRSYSGGDFVLNSSSFDVGTVAVISGANINIGFNEPFTTTDFLLQAAGNIQVTDSLVVDQNNNGKSEGLNISLLAGGNLNVGDNLSLTTNPIDVDTGGNITITSGGDVTVGGVLNLLVNNSNGGHIGTGGNILVTAANLSADSWNAAINNANTGIIDSNAIIHLNLTGDFATADAASFVISNREAGHWSLGA